MRFVTRRAISQNKKSSFCALSAAKAESKDRQKRPFYYLLQPVLPLLPVFTSKSLSWYAPLLVSALAFR
jgi:hypothetical protein